MAALTLQEDITPENLFTIYHDERIVNAISYDGKAPYPELHDLAHYVSVFLKNKFVGAFLFIRTSQYSADIHSLLLRDALSYSRQAGCMIIDYAFMKTEILRLTAPVMEDLKTAKNFCLKLGFKQEGFIRDAYLKNNGPKGVYMLGMTRKEWGEQ